VPAGRAAKTATAARQIAEELRGHVVVKARVLVGGRAKTGEVLFAQGPDGAYCAVGHLLGPRIERTLVRQVLVEEAAFVKSEISMAMTSDRERRALVAMPSESVGVDIEHAARLDPTAMATVTVHPFSVVRLIVDLLSNLTPVGLEI